MSKSTKPGKESKKIKEEKEIKLPKTWLPEKECVAAIGIEHADPKVRKFLIPEPSFTLLPVPTDKSAWLLTHEEEPQTFTDFSLQRGCRKNTSSDASMTTISGRLRNKKTMVQPDRQTIYLAPIGEFDANSPPLELLRQYIELYFRLPTKLMINLILTENDENGTTISWISTKECDSNDGKEENNEEKTFTRTITSRTNRGSKQFLTEDILDLFVEILPDDAFCIMGITMTDLYPQESWNFVLGLANIKQHVAIFSFARYSPSFGFPDDKKKKSLSGENMGMILQRSCKVAIHEIFHLFGVEHCQYYQCVMLGANSVEEEFFHPLELCPVCLSKLLHSVPSANLMVRYQALLNFYRSLPPTFLPAFKRDSDWLEARIKYLLEN